MKIHNKSACKGTNWRKIGWESRNREQQQSIYYKYLVSPTWILFVHSAMLINKRHIFFTAPTRSNRSHIRSINHSPITPNCWDHCSPLHMSKPQTILPFLILSWSYQYFLIEFLNSYPIYNILILLDCSVCKMRVEGTS